MIRQTKLLLILILIIVAGQTRAQKIDSFHINRSVNPHELFVRLHFPDSSYYIEHTFDRVALMYPPVNITTFFYRSCQFVKANPVRDTIIPIYLPEPYNLQLWLVRDSNTITPGCTFVGEIQVVDSAGYNPQHTGTINPEIYNTILNIFPNPATNILYVTSSIGSELSIFDALGRLQVRQKVQKGQEGIDISKLTPGLYHIHCYHNGVPLQSRCFSKIP